VLESDAQFITLDLRSSGTFWEDDAPLLTLTRPAQNLTADIVIVGAGITGAFVAERLSRTHSVVILDRHAPVRASTAASTALLQWEIDASMIELEDRLGFETAAAIYRRSVAAVDNIGKLDAALGGGSQFVRRDSIFLAGNRLDSADLREELRLRHRAGIEGEFLSGDALRLGFGFARDAALHHRGSAEVNPVRLAHRLLARAISRGAQIVSPVLVTDYDCGSGGVVVGTAEGLQVSGKMLVLANGYEMPPFVNIGLHRIVSTWALATQPQAEQVLWPGRALVWEASKPYIYMRTTPGRNIIMGGADEPIADGDVRDGLLPVKTADLAERLGELAPRVTTEIDTAWAGFFGETKDGLPLIGRVPGQPNAFAAFGYGGNGITFSAMAAGILDRLIHGGADPALDWFALDRA
jgi:glycine/D-amino acid oxidase-like deaminating enzyme